MNDIVEIYESKLYNNSKFRVYGFKHAIVGIIAASVLHPDTNFTITNVPNIDDVKVLCHILKKLGADIHLNEHTLFINTKNMREYNIEPELCADVHGVIYLLPSLITRFGKVSLYECGGCQIGNSDASGKRPVSHMLSVLELFGFSCKHIGQRITGYRYKKQENVMLDIMQYSESDSIITGPQISGATKTAILAGMSPIKIKTTIKNPYRKPDVTELVRLMKLLNYTISYDEQELSIERTEDVDKTKEVHFDLINDVSEIMTYICLAVFHHIEAEIQYVQVDLIKAGMAEEFRLLNKMGINLIFKRNSIMIPLINSINSININVTSIGIYSDHQPFFALLMSMANGESRIIENVWRNRFTYATELQKLGFNIHIEDRQIKITPNSIIHGEQKLTAKDLRSAAVLLIAALKAKGSTQLVGVSHLTRGYENLQQSLINCGAKLII